MDLYKIPVGDICSDADELVRRLNAAEQRVPTPERRRWRVECPLRLSQHLYQQQFMNPLAHFSYHQFSPQPSPRVVGGE